MSLRDDDLETDFPERERAALGRTVSRLNVERPVPGAVFRGSLRRRLIASSERAIPPLGLARTRWLAFGSLTVGAALLAIAGVGVADAGPLAPADVAEAVTSVISATIN
jgi:hypothetical protein